jgi:hypothetical protein
MADIFVSYKRADRESVAPIVGLLAAQGWSVWWDAQLAGGEHWDQVIEREINAARCVVVVWSPSSVDRKKSYYVYLEAHTGLERDILVPVTIQHAMPPFAFKLVQARDLSGWDGAPAHAAARDLVADVRRMVERKSTVVAPTPAEQQTDGQDVEELLEERSARLKEFLARYDVDHPTLKDLTPGELRAVPIPDDDIYTIWMGFRSRAGRAYTAVHVFRHASGPYILLSSPDRDRADFEQTRQLLAEVVGGQPEEEITDRGDDICSVIKVPDGFSRTRIADTFVALGADAKEAKVIVVHYARGSAA